MKKITRTPERIFVEGETIETIDGLENCQMVLVERKDALKKAIKGARPVMGSKNVFSVKEIKETLQKNAIKAAKKAKSVNKFELCCVCTEFVPVSNLNANGVCRCCQL
jgi:hypothetical protein